MEELVWNRVLRGRRTMKEQREIKKGKYSNQEERMARLGTVLITSVRDSHSISATAMPNMIY